MIPGDYYIEFIPPASLPVSSTFDGADDQTDGDDNGTQVDTNGDGLTDGPIRSVVINLAPTEEPIGDPGLPTTTDDNNGDNTIDFGLVPLMAIGSEIFTDTNDNGQRDPGEDNIGEKAKTVELELYNADTDELVAITTTDGSGQYIFDNLLPGNYYIQFMPPVTSPISSTGAAGDTQVDGDDNGIQADTNGDGITDGVITSPVIALVPGTEALGDPGLPTTTDDDNNDMTVDFGLIESADISLVKTVNNSTPAIGEIVTFTITVNNDGPANITNAEITDMLPNG